MAEFNTNHNVQFKDDDFVLVQQTARITDTKLATKPTTFFKDALRRFAKNKSSVVAAFILAILIGCAIIVPMVSDANIDKVSTIEGFLAPKLFDAGTGFWDGTRVRKRIVYDTVNEVPALSDRYTPAALKQSIVSITVDPEPTPIDAASVYGQGGVIMFATDAAVSNNDAFLMSQQTTFTPAGGYTFDAVLDSEAGVNEAQLGEYTVYFQYGENPEDKLIIRDWSRDYSPIHYDISAALTEAGFKYNTKGRVVFELRSSESGIQYILLKSAVFSTVSGRNKDDLAAISFTDATKMINVSDTKSLSYWSCSGRKGIHNSLIYYCDFVVDTYMLVYGNADTVTYSATEVNNWIENGWCTYDHKVGPSSFVKLDDRCPIDEVVDQQVLSVTKKLASVTGRGWGYHKLGYDEMPRFILGTDVSGFDLFKRSFAGLRTSLVLGFCTFLFCFAFGLIWGSISGYFGGNVDLFMERFCDILGGVPWIVVMTLAILHLGNNFFTFFLALCMTGWMGTAARTRTQFYRFKGREYVLASRTLGSSDMRLILKHILPNSMGTIITSSVLMIPSTIFSEATLAYLNLGLQGVHSFGVMMANNQQYLGLYPNLVIFPAVVMALMMISFNLFGNGLRDAFNPSLKGSE